MSTKQPALVGDSYRHDNRQIAGDDDGEVYAGDSGGGRYEVRLLYVATSESRDECAGDDPQRGRREDGVGESEGGVPVERRAAGAWACLRSRREDRFGGVSNADADGFVVVDGVQFVPADVAQERTGHARGCRVSGDADAQGRGAGPRAG